MLPSTPLDSLVKQILDPRPFSTRATEWGKKHEPIALEQYIQYQISLGHAGLVTAKSGFVVCEGHPFLGASPDGLAFDPSC